MSESELAIVCLQALDVAIIEMTTRIRSVGSNDVTESEMKNMFTQLEKYEYAKSYITLKEKGDIK